MVEKKVIHRLADGITGLERNLSTGFTRVFRFCKVSEIHWEDVDKAKFGCNVADPAGVMAGIRWVPCACEAVAADPNERIAAEEKWMKTLCHQHYLVAQSLLRRIRLAAEQSKLEKEIAQAKLEHDTIKNWVSYPEHTTVTVKFTVVDPLERMALFILQSKDYIVYKKHCGPASLD